MTAESRAKNIKILIFDVDGVLTDGQIFIFCNAEDHIIEGKGCAAHDVLRISPLVLGGLRIGIITKRNSQTVAIRANDLKLEFIYQGQSHKMDAIRDILAKTGATIDQLCYVGDDVIDLPVMRQCGLSIATANARKEAKAAAHYITPNPGGFGAGRDAIDFILTAQGTLETVIEQYLDESNKAAASSDVGQGNM
jgi:3-deoxy-D-manno-octulosonate 8-phosphate phosphatase (KDO 8-P phosphatase)